MPASRERCRHDVVGRSKEDQEKKSKNGAHHVRGGHFVVETKSRKEVVIVLRCGFNLW